MKTKLMITGITLLGIGGAMHLGKVRTCPLGMMIHGLPKHTVQKTAAKPLPAITSAVATTAHVR
jgi:hypothetical protein